MASRNEGNCHVHSITGAKSARLSCHVGHRIACRFGRGCRVQLHLVSAGRRGRSQFNPPLHRQLPPGRARPSFAGASPPRAGPSANWCPTQLPGELRRRCRQATRKACNSPRCRNSCSYWGTDYDWSKCEARLNALPHFITEIDGLDIHFIHVKSKHQGALPVIITHGWPGSVIELLKIIDPLTNPTAHGGTEADAFDVVIPSMPGYGFSGKPTETGWDPMRIAKAWTVLMKRLGYDRFVAQGGDWGALITEQMALMAPPELIAIHTNMPATIPPEIVKALAAGSPPPADLAPDEKRAYEQVAFFYKFGLGYANEMALRPQTLYGIVDSPAGLAAWILDHDADSYALIARSFDGEPEGLTRDDILDNITLYWLTNTAISSARLYWEHRQTAKAGFFDAKGITIPVGVSANPSEIYTAPKSWTERAFPKLLHYGRRPRAATSRHGNSRSTSPRRCAHRSRRCGA